MRNSRMKKILGMTSRQREKVQIIFIGICLLILIFIIHQIVSNYKVIRMSSDNVQNRYRVHGRFNTPYSINILQMLGGSDKLKSFTGEKLIHLDLKGAAPLVSFYAELFPFLKRIGATGLLIEYEDMFPYRDELEQIKAHNAYTPSDVSEILRLAEYNGLSVIPLVQTAGHLEFVLKLQKFRELREVDDYPLNLCPSHEKAHSLVEKMIDQIMEAHPRAKYIHIGCDEVFFLGRCDKCKRVMRKNVWTTDDLFVAHVKRTALYINNKYPGVRPIMWSDMLHHLSGKILKSSQIAQSVDIMVWTYWSEVSNAISNNLLQKFAKYFKSIWIASAFKGATTASSLVPNVGYHLANHISWMSIVSTWRNSINFKGIAITGWQRYDHFAVLCELLPVGLPSLTLDLLFLQNFSAEDHELRLLKLLKCEGTIGFDPPEFEVSEGANCDFPGFEIFSLVYKFANFISKLKSSPASNVKGGWFSMYNVVHKFTSPFYVEKIFHKWPLEAYKTELDTLEEKLTKALSRVYDQYTVKEWIMTHLTPIKMQMNVFLKAREAMLEEKVWPRRPFVTESALENSSDICGVNSRFGCALLMTSDVRPNNGFPGDAVEVYSGNVTAQLMEIAYEAAYESRKNTESHQEKQRK